MASIFPVKSDRQDFKVDNLIITRLSNPLTYLWSYLNLAVMH
jgi:hypothetical protein